MGQIVAMKRPLGLPERWEDEKLLLAVRSHLFGAGADTVADILGTSVQEVKHWTRSKQWGELTRLVQPQVADFLADQMMRLSNKALLALDDCMERGDPVLDMSGAPKLDEDGNPIYRPLKAKDLAEIATKVMAERRALLAKATAEEDDEDRISLRALAAALKDAGEKKLRVIEGEATTQ